MENNTVQQPGKVVQFNVVPVQPKVVEQPPASNNVTPVQNNVTEPIGAGRPSSITPEVVTLLEAAFQRGFSVTTACTYAKITRRAFYDRYKADEVFRYKIDSAKIYNTVIAGNVVTDVLTGKLGDTKDRIHSAWKWLEKKESDEFGNKQPLIGQQNNTQNNYVAITDEQLKQLASESRIGQLDAEQVINIIETANVAGSGTEETPMELH